MRKAPDEGEQSSYSRSQNSPILTPPDNDDDNDDDDDDTPPPCPPPCPPPRRPPPPPPTTIATKIIHTHQIEQCIVICIQRLRLHE